MPGERVEINSTLNTVITQFERRTQPRPLFESDIERLSAVISRKSVERDSALVKSPFLPGILFRKSGTIQRIERENVETWENIVDYLIRRYRVDQLPLKKLAAEIGISQTRTIRRNLPQIGIPLLRSSE